MKAIRLAVGVLLLVLASKPCAQTVAQSVEGSLRESPGGSSQPDYADSLPAQREATTRVPADNHLWHTWDQAAFVTDKTTPDSPEELFPAPDYEDSQDDGLDACCCPPCESACPSVYAQVEALFMWRESRLINQPIVVDAITGTTYLSASDLDSGYSPGLRATIGKRLCGGRALEFTYFGLCEGDTSAVVVSPDPGAFLIFPGNLFGNVFVGMDRVQVNYSSWLNSFEANLPCCCGCCEECCDDECCDECCDECGCPEIHCESYEWIAGFRYIRIGERLDIAAQNTVGGAVETGSYDIRTTNNLYGLQLGGRMRRTQGRYGWEATGKGGIFGNDAQQRQSVTDFPDFPIRPTVSSSSGGVAYVGEANLSALYRLTRVWNLRAGYTVLWIEGLALAPDQLDFDFASSTSGTQLHNGGAMLLHGVNFGLEARW